MSSAPAYLNDAPGLRTRYRRRRFLGIGATWFDRRFVDGVSDGHLLAATAEHSADGSRMRLDFGFGDAEYKRHWDECRPEEDVVLVERRAAARAQPRAHQAPGGRRGHARRAAPPSGRRYLEGRALRGATRAAGGEGQARTAPAGDVTRPPRHPLRLRRPRPPGPARARGERGARPPARVVTGAPP